MTPDRTEPLERIAEFGAKLKRLEKAEQEARKTFEARQRILNEWTDGGGRAPTEQSATGQSATEQSDRTRKSGRRSSGCSKRSRKHRKRSPSTDEFGRRPR